MTPVARRRRHALAIYREALAGADPRPHLRAALEQLPRSPAPLFLVAIGKAARSMAEAALAAARHAGRQPVGGLVVAARPGGPPGLRVVLGDHPVPGERSARAAAALGTLVSSVPAGAEVWVLLSGGASSLVAAPVEGIPRAAFETAWRVLHGAGFAIAELNLIRKRFSQWGAGRLALALAPATVRTFALSDVPGDDPAAIGSGPCDPDPSTAGVVRRALGRTTLLDDLPASIRQHLAAVERGTRPETPKPGAAAFRTAGARVIAGNGAALDAAERAAARFGYRVERPGPPLAGEAARCGAGLGAALVAAARGDACLLWGGETVVTLPPRGVEGTGGRSQELALAAAGVLERSSSREGVLLAGSTDGRDGPTDAAGALVDGGTWSRCRAAGIDPEEALAGHASYGALGASGDLVKVECTGTNVMDVVVGLTG